VAAIQHGLQKTLYLGNLDAKRDWGHARDFVEGMWRIVQHDTPDDWVLATGETRTVREFVDMAFACVGRTIEWSGKGVEEKGRDAATGEILVQVDPEYFRPTEVELLLGDPSKAKRELGWTATTTLEQMVREMVESDLKLVLRDKDRNNREG